MTTATEFQTLVSKAVVNMTRLDGIINGGETTDVVTDGGVVPSYRKTIKSLLSTILAAPPPGWLSAFQGAGLSLNNKGDPGGNVMSVGQFVNLPTMSIPVGTDLLQTSGVTRGPLVADTSLTDADVTAFPHCVAKTANGRYFRRDERNFNLAMVGLSGGAADDAPGVREAIAFLTKFTGTSYQADSIFKVAPTLYLPLGLIRLDTPISIKSVINILGGDNGVDGGRGTVFNCASTGFILERADTQGGTYTPTITTASDGSLLSNFSMLCTGSKPYAQETGDHGIILKSHSVLKNLNIQYFSGCGIRVVASATGSGGTGTEVGNANCFRIENVTSSNNYHGIYIRGADANAGFVIGANVSSNASCGVLDASFLGNTHIGHHGSGNGIAIFGTAPTIVSYNGSRYAPVFGQDAAWSTQAPGTGGAWVFFESGGPIGAAVPTWTSGTTYKFGAIYATIDRNCRSVFVGCYTEGTQAVPQISWPAIAFGGLLNQMGDGMWLNGEQRSVNAYKFAAGGGFMNSDPNAGGGAVGTSGPSLPPFAMKPQGADVRFDFGNADSYVPMLVNGPGTGHYLGPNAVRFNVALGLPGGTGACLGYVDSKPTITLYYRAFVLNNFRNAVTDPVGWTVVPTTNTWLPFGAQAA